MLEDTNSLDGAHIVSLVYRGDDQDYQEHFLKPELIKFLMKMYASKFEENDPAKFSLRDKIIECARLAVEVCLKFKTWFMLKIQTLWTPEKIVAITLRCN